ncbi:hypothetical protein RJ639_007716 [Escallonia herrerae]|uniref:Oxidative stress 3 n=1 Tax=Escallonia herrerae TaxID=1293975 RepID=A0AA88VWE0_9ASTE|nr:hypothetical protein RJ639_007716 [Escallonia herrerae]
MGAEKQIYQDMALKENGSGDMKHVQWVIMEADQDDISDSDSIDSDNEYSSNSVESSSSSDMVEEDASSCTSSSPPSSYGPLYELSELMAQLPIKRGLSKHYQGKSQSFASLASVKSLEDLAKKGNNSYRKTMKPCKSYGGGLDGSKFGPKATIRKKDSRGSFVSSLARKGGNVLVGSCRPSVTVQNIFLS